MEINVLAMDTYKQFKSETSLEMQDLATSIVDMAESIKALKQMRDRQEELQ